MILLIQTLEIKDIWFNILENIFRFILNLFVICFQILKQSNGLKCEISLIFFPVCNTWTGHRFSHRFMSSKFHSAVFRCNRSNLENHIRNVRQDQDKQILFWTKTKTFLNGKTFQHNFTKKPFFFQSKSPSGQVNLSNILFSSFRRDQRKKFLKIKNRKKSRKT